MSETSTNIANLLDRCYVLVLRTGMFGNTRQLSDDQYEVKANKEWTAAQNKLLESPELKAVGSLMAKARNWIQDVAVPSPLGKGLPLVAISMAEEIATKLQEYETAIDAAVDQFMAVYADQVDVARVELKGLFNEKNYPPQDVVREKFSFTWSFLPMGDPDKLPPTLLEVEREKARRRAEETWGTIQLALRSTMAGMVDHMVDLLTTGPDGKKKILRDANLRNLSEYMRTFSARNVTDDAALEALVNQARDILDGVSTVDLKSDDGMREKVRTGMAEIKVQLSTMVADAPKRQISFGDD